MGFAVSKSYIAGRIVFLRDNSQMQPPDFL